MKRTPIKRKKGINKITLRVRERNAIWRGITQTAYFAEEMRCKWCKASGQLFLDELWGIWGHHIDRNRNNCTQGNCYPVHNACHQLITDQNIDVLAIPDLKTYTDIKMKSELKVKEE